VLESKLAQTGQFARQFNSNRIPNVFTFQSAQTGQSTLPCGD